MRLRSINVSSSGVNKLFAQPFRSEKIGKIFQVLSEGGKLARDLAKVINTDSKQIFPRLKRYILKGWIYVTKINNINVYYLSDTAKKILKLQGSNFEKVREKAEKILGRKLDNDETEILRFFYELNSYLERSENESIAEQVYYALKKRIALSKITEILTEFTKAKILFAFRLKSGVILKVRLNKNLLL
jgi:hypothetical protein